MTRLPQIRLGDIGGQADDHLYECNAFNRHFPSNTIKTTHMVGLHDSARRPTGTRSIERVDPKRLRLHTTTDRIDQLHGLPFDKSASRFLAWKLATDMDALSARDPTQKIFDMRDLRAQRQFVLTLTSMPADSSSLFCQIRIHVLRAKHFASMLICVIPKSATG